MEADSVAPPSLYFDLGSPYSWLAYERFGVVMGTKAILEPVLIGGIFQLRGWGSWSQTETREENISEVERRAAVYRIGQVVWPEKWPNNTLLAMRCSLVAEDRGALDEFTRAAFRAAFREGRDLSDGEVLAELAAEAGLDWPEVLEKAEGDETKAALRARTDRAWSLGVAGAPAVKVGGQIFYGDDQLELAARAFRDEDPGR